MSADALYRQGMAYYRRHQWRQARDSFRDLKQAHPEWREIDTLLDELEIFIRLESLASSRSCPHDAAAAGLAPLSTTGQSPSRRARIGTTPQSLPAWVAPALAGALVMVSLIYAFVNPRLGRRVAELRELGQAHSAAEQWSDAINAYELLLLLAPRSPEDSANLSLAYFQRGQERSEAAQALEERQLYREAAQQWEMALADLRAARAVAPDRNAPTQAGASAGQAGASAGQAGLAEQIALTENRRRCASLLSQANQLRQERRWPDAIQALNVLRGEAPGCRPAEVQAHLSESYRESGLAALGSAKTVAQVREGVRLLEQACEVQPSSDQARTLLRRAQSYLQAVLSYDARQWGAAIRTLEALLQEGPGDLDGRARELLCHTYLLRATDRQEKGELRLALADYEALLAAGCQQRAAAAPKATMIALALTPTATPTATPTRTAAAAPTPDVTLDPSPTPHPAEQLTPSPSPAP